MKRIQSGFIAATLVTSFIITPITPLFAQEASEFVSFPDTGAVFSQTDSSPTNTEGESSNSTAVELGTETPNSTESSESNDEPNQEAQATTSSSNASIEGSNPPTPVKQIKPETDISTGALTYTYEIKLPEGRKGVTPNLGISYNSQNLKDGSFVGYGWNINIPYIERQNKKGTNTLYSLNSFTSSVSGELVANSGDAYSPRFEDGTNLKYTLIDSSWVVVDKSGTTYTYGATAGARQDNPADTTKIYKWMLEKVEDSNGNTITYTYFKDQGQIYPERITYSNTSSSEGVFKVDFIRTERVDALDSYTTAFLVKTQYLLSEIRISTNSSLTKKYDLSYTRGDNEFRSLLQKVTETSYVLGIPNQLPSTDFEYSNNDSQLFNSSSSETLVNLIPVDIKKGTIVGDLNGDAYSDFFTSYEYTYAGYFEIRRAAIFNPKTNTFELSNNFEPLLPMRVFTDWSYGALDGGVRLIDINGDGKNDLLKTKYGFDPVRVLNINTGTGWEENFVVKPEYNLYPTYTSNPWHSVFAQDFNGDGLVDYLQDNGSQGTKTSINTGEGFDYTLPIFSSPVFTGGGDYIMLDINGDKLPDFVRALMTLNSCSNCQPMYDQKVYINNGNYWTLDNSYQLPQDFYFYQNTTWYTGPKAIDVSDFNNDGLDDFYDGSFHINKGKSFLTVTADYWFSNVLNASCGLCQNRYALMDFDADGDYDFVSDNQLAVGTYPRVYFNKTPTPNDVLKSITLPTGSSYKLEYKSSAQYRNPDNSLANPKLPFIIQTVNTITTNDGNGTTATDTFSYENGSYYYKNPTDRKFAGFEKVTQTKPDGSKSVSYFHQGNDANTAQGEVNDHAGKIGKVYREDVTDAQNNIFKRTWYSWDSVDRPSDSSYTYLTSTLEQLYGPNASHTDKATTTTYNMQNGNVQSVTEWGEVQSTPTSGAFTDIGNDKRVTTISYATNPSETIFAPSEIVKSDQSGNVFEKSRLYYDNLPLHTLSKGNNTKKDLFKNASQFITTKKTFNQKGLVTTEEDGKGNVTHYTYDAHDLYPQTITNPLLQDTVYTYDYVSGKPLSITTPNTTFTTEYDGFGRVTKENIPNENGTLVTKTQYLYTDTPNNVAIKKIEHLTPTNAVESYTYFDGQGREIQSKREAEGGNWATTDTLYDSSGRIAKKSLPYFTQSSTKSSPTTNQNLYSIFSYDPLNRMLTQTRSTGSLSILYDLSRKRLTDEAGKTKVFTTDAFNNLVQVTEVNNGAEYNTLYEYNSQNNLTKVTDANGNVRHFTYDLLGRRLSAEDIHATNDTNFGVYTFTYDNNGNVISKVTPKAQTISYTYDSLNRIATEDLGPTPGVEVVYLYDNCLNGVGKLCEVYGMDIVKTEFAYKKDGQIAKEMKYLSGDIFTTHYTKDYQGNVVGITNPNQASIHYTYNNAGIVDAVAYVHGEDTKVVVSNVDYAPTGVPTLQVNGNGTQTCNVYDADKLYRLISRKTVVGTNCDGVTNPPAPTPNPTEEPPIPGTDPIVPTPPGFDDPLPPGPGEEEVASIPGEGTPSDGTPTPTPTSVTILPSPLVQPLIQSLVYTYDPVGNILSIVDSVKGTTKAYTYDDLHRLTTVANPAVPGLEEVFFYDPIGNITLYNNIPYTYQTPGKTNPHAATQVGTHTLTYDANGNLLSDGALTNTWNYNNTLHSTTKGDITTSHLYDYTGSRVEKSTDALTILYPSSYFIQEGGETTSLISLNNQNIATIKDGQAVFNHTDHLGSTTVSTNDQGSIVEQTVYASFGEETHRATFNTTQARKYIGEMYDGETDLNYLNARYYDGKRGQFMGQDPVFWSPEKLLDNPQSMNSYSYGNNNPITNKDPLGLYAIKTGTIEKGDTLSKITNILNTTNSTNYSVSQVAKLNGIKDVNKITIGQTLVPNESVPDVTKSLLDTSRSNAKSPAGNSRSQFILNVVPGNVWDTKNITNGIYDSSKFSNFIFGAEKVRSDFPGNFHYGYVGMQALKQNESLLLYGAGGAQVTHDLINLKMPQGTLGTYFDNAGDSSFIKTGINYWKNDNQ